MVDQLGEAIHEIEHDHHHARPSTERSLDPDEQTSEMYPDATDDRPGWHVRLFGSHEFFRLWLVQVVSAIGDWSGFSAIILLAAASVVRRGGRGAGAISLVMAARIVPGFFFGPLAGVLVDRWDRKKVDDRLRPRPGGGGRVLPFVHNLVGWCWRRWCSRC